MMPALEVYVLRPGPDGLTRVSCRAFGEGVRRSWLVPSADAEELILDEWRELHDALLAFPPGW